MFTRLDSARYCVHLMVQLCLTSSRYEDPCNPIESDNDCRQNTSAWSRERRDKCTVKKYIVHEDVVCLRMTHSKSIARAYHVLGV